MSVDGQLDLMAALEQVEAGADDVWWREAEWALRTLIRSQRPFTSDDVFALVSAPCREPRAMGAMIRKARRERLIVPTGAYVEAQNSRAHLRPQRQWVGVA